MSNLTGNVFGNKPVVDDLELERVYIHERKGKRKTKISPPSV